MPLPQASADFYQSQQRTQVLTLASVRSQWARMGPDFDGSWQTVGPRLLTLLSAAQLAAARAGFDYIGTALDEMGVDAPAEGTLNARALAGVASDGRPLDSLLYESVIRAKSEIGAGAPVRDALASGRNTLDLITRVQVTDAGRIGSGIGIASRPGVAGYVRQLNPPSCGRCAILGGKFYRWNAGFERHFSCDCTHVPVDSIKSPVAAERIDPDAYFRSLSTQQQDDLFGVANSRAIRDGADLARAVNATGRKSGVYTAGGRKYTRDLRHAMRPTPEHIYEVAEDRADAIRLLRFHGYIL